MWKKEGAGHSDSEVQKYDKQTHIKTIMFLLSLTNALIS